MKWILALLTFTVLATEVIVDPYKNLDREKINSYTFDIQEKEDCTCYPWE